MKTASTMNRSVAQSGIGSHIHVGTTAIASCTAKNATSASMIHASRGIFSLFTRAMLG
jgi:hypothetical protein